MSALTFFHLVSEKFHKKILAAAAVATTVAASGTAAGDVVKMTFAGHEIVIDLLDSPMAQAFLNRLPMTLTFEDFNGNEKISYLQQKLSIAGDIHAEETKRNFCYYAPWGNLAVFYQDIGYSESLYILGTIRSGKELLARQKGDFRAMIDRVKPPVNPPAADVSTPVVF